MSAIDLIYKPVYANLLKKNATETPKNDRWVFLLHFTTGKDELKLFIFRSLFVKIKEPIELLAISGLNGV